MVSENKLESLACMFFNHLPTLSASELKRIEDGDTGVISLALNSADQGLIPRTP